MRVATLKTERHVPAGSLIVIRYGAPGGARVWLRRRSSIRGLLLSAGVGAALAIGACEALWWLIVARTARLR